MSRCSYIRGIPLFLAVFSQLAITQFHLIQRLYFVVLYVLLAYVLCPLVGCWRASQCCRKYSYRRRQNSGGSVSVEGSGPRVQLQSRNGYGGTILGGGHGSSGVIHTISYRTMDRPPCSAELLPMHLRDLLDQMSRDLSDMQQRQLAGVLLHYCDMFPMPGSTLTGYTDAVEQEIDTGDGSPIRCAPRRMSPQKMVKKMGAPGSVSTINGSTMRLSRMPIPCPELTILWICWRVNSDFLLWT